jgi:thiamine pyrophosphokinase
MSSHHIVRDEQEPALLICDLDDIPTEVLHSLLEWSPTVVCCEQALSLYLSKGHKVDVALINSANYESWWSVLGEQQPVKIIALSEVDFLDGGLTMLQKNDHKSVNILSSRASLPEVVLLLEKWLAYMDVTILTEKTRVILCNQTEFKKWVPKETIFEVRSISKFTNWKLSGEGIEMISTSDHHKQFRMTIDGELTIQSDRIPFIIEEAW